MNDPKILSENIQKTLLEITTEINDLKNTSPITFGGMIMLDLVGQLPLYGFQYILGGSMLGYLIMESMVGIPDRITMLEEEYQFLTDLNNKIETTDITEDYITSIEYLETLKNRNYVTKLFKYVHII